MSLALRYAWRELRGGIRGFRLFVACLALGVTAVAAVQTLAGAVQDGLLRDGRRLLGGDIAMTERFTPPSPAAVTALRNASAATAQSAELRAMARVPAAEPGTADRTALVELRAVDSAYPLIGTLRIRNAAGDVQELPARDVAALLKPEPGNLPPAAMDPLAAERLGLKPGDSFRLGTAEFQLLATVEQEPDRAGAGLQLGPRLLIALPALEGTGLVQQGSLIDWSWRALLKPGLQPIPTIADIRRQLPQETMRLRDWQNATPSLSSFIDRLALFLSLVGMTALLVGGVGVGNAVRAFVEGRLRSIAVLKCLGAPVRLVLAIYLTQVSLLAGLAIGIGLVLGGGLPMLALPLLADVLPVPVGFSIQPAALATAAAAGLLVTLVFSLWPLGLAGRVPAADLFRAAVLPARGRPPRSAMAAILVAALLLAVLVVGTAVSQKVAGFFILGAALAWGIFRLLAALLLALLRRLAPRLPRELRLAAASLARPGAGTATVLVSLGLGLTVMVGIALVQANFQDQIAGRIPRNAPSFFVADIAADQRAQLNDIAAATPGMSDLRLTPSLRGRIAAVRGQEPRSQLVAPDKGWVLNGDRGVTYAAEMPAGTQIVAGSWWDPGDTAGPPRISIASDIADAFDLKIGERITINLLGRDFEAQVANIRNVVWTSLSMNFTLVFAPGTLEAAPATWLATLRVPVAEEAGLQGRLVAAMPNLTVVRVRDVLDEVTDLLGQLGLAVQAVAAVTLLAGVLVLSGALAATQRARVYEAAVLKTYGATRAALLRQHLLSFGLLGLIAAGMAVLVGSLGAWAVVSQAMEWPWSFDAGAALGISVLCVTIALGAGWAVSRRALAQPAAPLLRNE